LTTTPETAVCPSSAGSLPAYLGSISWKTDASRRTRAGCGWGSPCPTTWRPIPPHQRVNLLLFCDADIIFRNGDTLFDLAQTIVGTHAAFAGELFLGRPTYPEAQASFFAVRRGCYARPDVSPSIHHSAPAYLMQRSLW